MALPFINVLMSCVASCFVGSVYFYKIFFDFGVNAFVTNFFPMSTAALFPASKAFFAPFLATLLPTSRVEDAICLAALLVKIIVKRFVMVSNIPDPPYAYLPILPRSVETLHQLLYYRSKLWTHVKLSYPALQTLSF